MKPQFGKENAFSAEFKDECRKHGAYAISVAASLYMSGQPDIDITSNDGQNTKVELKVFRQVAVPTRASCLALLRGPQINVITTQLWRRNCNCIILVQIGAKPDTSCIISKHGFYIDLWRNVAKICATLPFGRYTPWQNPN